MIVDDDTGICDDCGSEDGDRSPVVTSVKIDGQRTLVNIWVCAGCLASRNVSRSKAYNRLEAFLAGCVEDCINGDPA